MSTFEDRPLENETGEPFGGKPAYTECAEAASTAGYT